MSGDDVQNDDMPNFLRPAGRDVPPLSDAALAALLAGTEAPEEPTPELQPVADVLAALRAAPSGGELAAEAAALAEFRRATGADVVPSRASRRPRALTSLLGARVAVAALAAALGLGGLATVAYAGVLPAPLQRFAHETIGAPAAPGSSPSGAHLARGRIPRAQGATSAAASRLCAKYNHARADGTATQRAVALRDLAKAARGAGRISAYCRAAAHPGSSHRPGGKQGPPGRKGKTVPPGQQGKTVPPGHKDKPVPPGHQSGHHASHSKGKSAAHKTAKQGNHGAPLAAGTGAQQNPARHRAVTSRSS